MIPEPIAWITIFLIYLLGTWGLGNDPGGIFEDGNKWYWRLIRGNAMIAFFAVLFGFIVLVALSLSTLLEIYT